jgi:hypothetical protein
MKAANGGENALGNFAWSFGDTSEKFCLSAGVHFGNFCPLFHYDTIFGDPTNNPRNLRA